MILVVGEIQARVLRTRVQNQLQLMMPGVGVRAPRWILLPAIQAITHIPPVQVAEVATTGVQGGEEAAVNVQTRIQPRSGLQRYAISAVISTKEEAGWIAKLAAQLFMLKARLQ